MIEITQCTTNDSKLISQLSNTIWHECYEEMLSLEQRNYMLENFMNDTSIQKHINNNINYYLIKIDTQIAGFFAYKIHEDHIYLHKLYSLKHLRGKGIMKYIMNYLQTYKKDIKLNTCKYNKTLQIYLYSGFEIIKEECHDIGNNFFMDDYILLKKYNKTFTNTK